MSAHQECQFAERITRSCALRSNRLTMFPSNLAIGKQILAGFVILNYQFRKHMRDRSRSRPHVFTALLDNVDDHRAAAIDLQAEKPARPAAPSASYCYPTTCRCYSYSSVVTLGCRFHLSRKMKAIGNATINASKTTGYAKVPRITVALEGITNRCAALDVST